MYVIKHGVAAADIRCGGVSLFALFVVVYFLYTCIAWS